MRVPVIPVAARQIAGSGVDLHHGNAGFDQSSGQQHALSADVIAVHRADSGIFAIQVVGIFDRRAEQHVCRHFAEAVESVVVGLRADRSFELRTFLPGARTAYDMILNSFAGGDTDTLRALLDDEVFASFEHAIRDRESRGETLETRVAGVKSTDVVEARTRGRLAEITVKFVSEIVNVTRDSDNKVISGDERSAQSLTDYWTFVRDTRAGDPNWKLVATRSEN